jgi:O-antigen/teichoic acid export membrane protein
MKRLLKRIRPISLVAGTFLAAALTNAGAAWWVIRESSQETWGGFVDALIIAGLSLHILSWGSQEYLLRAFARHPDQAGMIWRQNLVTRGALLFIALPAVLLAGFSTESAAYLLLWIFAGFLRKSFQPVITFRREFGFEMLLEAGAAVLLFTGLILEADQLSPEVVLRWFAFAWTFRALGVALKYGRELFPGDYPRIQFRYFQLALPFFLLGFMGMLMSRVDMYCVALFMEGKAPLAKYQLLMSFLLYLQATAGFILLPNAKNYYRLPDKSLFKLARRMFLIGIPITLAGLTAIWLTLKWAYGIEFDWIFFAVAAAFVLPIFYLSPLIYLLFKRDQQRQVVLANGAGILLNIGLNIALIPVFDLLGALIATTTAQALNIGLIVAKARR